MALINELKRGSDVFISEADRAFNYTRDTVTLASGGAPVVIGQVLGKITASGKYIQVAPAASDGSQIAAAVSLTTIDPTSADQVAVVVTRGPAIAKTSGLVFTGGMSGPQIVTAKAQLLAIGIKLEQDYGV